MILDDTITPTSTAIRALLVGSVALEAHVGERVYLAAAPDKAAYPHVVMMPQPAYERDQTHADLSWQPQQWDIYGVANKADDANVIAGLVAATLNGQTLSIDGTPSLVVRRMGTMPAQRVRLSDTVNKYMAAATMLVGVRTGGQA